MELMSQYAIAKHIIDPEDMQSGRIYDFQYYNFSIKHYTAEFKYGDWDNAGNEVFRFRVISSNPPIHLSYVSLYPGNIINVKLSSGV